MPILSDEQLLIPPLEIRGGEEGSCLFSVVLLVDNYYGLGL